MVVSTSQSPIDGARYPRLSRIQFPADLRQFDEDELPAIADELRSLAGGPPNLEAMRQHVRAAVNRVTREEKARKAVVIPIVLEV